MTCSNAALNVAVLVVSTTAARDPKSDTVVETLTSVIESEAKNVFSVAESKIVADDTSQIQHAIMNWTDRIEPDAELINLVLTSGGTGFAPSDQTPEAVSALLEKHAPGLIHKMLSESISVTPFGAVSRPVAGIRKQTIILTLPGSPKGARENLAAVIRLLPHLCSQLAGEDSRTLHIGGVEKLEKDAGISIQSKSDSQSNQTHRHHHHHHKHGHAHGHGGHVVPTPHTDQSKNPQSNDPRLGPSRRARSSPYEMLSVEEALNQIATQIPEPEVIKEQFTLNLVSHVLAADVHAQEAVPAFRASIVDGYAVRIPENAASNSKGIFPVAFASHAVAGEIPELPNGSVSRITTGAPLPKGSNAVVMVEDTVLTKMTEDGKEEAEIEILTNKVKSGENVREVGSDVQLDSLVMRKGDGISSIGGELGLLASVGARVVEVYKRPLVGVMSTGDEIVPIEQKERLKLGEVRDSNRPSLLSTVKSHGFIGKDFGIISDKPGNLESSLREALSKCDVLITSGGVSMGEYDLLKPTIERALGGTIHFGRVSMKPGKPTTFATVPASNIKDPKTGERAAFGRDKVIFSLPGNPASAIVTFLLFVLPALHQMSGVTPVGLPMVSVVLDDDVQCDAVREEYHRAVVSAKRGATGILHASSTGGQRSSRVGSFKAANALLKLPARGGNIQKGSVVEALLMGPISGLADA